MSRKPIIIYLWSKLRETPWQNKVKINIGSSIPSVSKLWNTSNGYDRDENEWDESLKVYSQWDESSQIYNKKQTKKTTRTDTFSSSKMSRSRNKNKLRKKTQKRINWLRAESHDEEDYEEYVNLGQY